MTTVIEEEASDERGVPSLRKDARDVAARPNLLPRRNAFGRATKLLHATNVRTRVVANIVGAVLDKALPLIIALLLTRYMSSDSFGLWSQYFQIVLIARASLLSPNQLFFSRDLRSQRLGVMRLYNFPVIIALLAIIALVLFFNFSEISQACHPLLLLTFVFLFFLYGYYTAFLRFLNFDKLYAGVACLRVCLFAAGVALLVAFSGALSFRNLVLVLIVCHVPIAGLAISRVHAAPRFETDTLSEYFRLFVYGLLTASLSGLDRFATTIAGYSYDQLGVYCYALTLASVPSCLIEGAKQYLSPIMYREFSRDGDISRDTRNKIFLTLGILMLVQLALPLALLWTLEAIGLVQSAYVVEGATEKVIVLFSVAYCAHIVYHFVNPYLLFFNRSHVLTISQILAVVFYIVVVLSIHEINDISFAAARLVMVFLMLLCPLVLVCVPTLRKRYVYRQL